MFAAGGILPWHQTQPGRELAPTAEAARFYHCGGDGCGDDRADARNARQALADGVALVPGHELLLDRRNRRLQLLNLCRQHLEHLARQIRQPRVALIADNGNQLADVAQALRRDHAELSQMPAQSVHQTRTLAHQPLPATVQQHSSLLVSRLDRHKAHRRAPNRLADRFRIGGIVLVALDVRLHVLRRHQSHLVAKRAQLPPPVVRRRARLQANQTGRQSTEERQNLRTPKLLAHNRRSLCINPVHLKNMLRQVQSDRSNLAHGWLPFAAVSIRQQFGTQMPQGGHPPHHSITSSAICWRWAGTSRPSVLAVLRPMIGSTFVISWTGKPRRRNATLHGWRKLCRPAQLMSVCLPRAQPAVERESPTFPGDTHL